jgi:Domain of unknown function (DUF5667)
MSRRGAEERFASFLDGTVARPDGTALTLDPAMAPMLSLAGALRTTGLTIGATAPDPAFRSALRQRLVAVATVTALDPTTATTRARSASLVAVRHRTQRRLAALAGAVALSTSLAGVGFAASMSLPGNPFYGVKRTTEAVQLWTARGNAAKGHRNLEFAQTRLAEAEQLPANSSHLASTLAAMNAETNSGSDELIASYQSSNSTEPLDDLTSFAHTQYAGLVQLASTQPVAARAPEATAIAVLGRVIHRVHTVSHGTCTQCAPLRGLPMPSGGAPSNPGNPTGTGGLPRASGLASPSPGARTGSTGSGTGTGPMPSPAASGGATPSSGPTAPSTPSTPTPLLPLPTLSPLPTVLPLPHRHRHPHPHPTLSPIPLVTTLLGGLGL